MGKHGGVAGHGNMSWRMQCQAIHSLPGCLPDAVMSPISRGAPCRCRAVVPAARRPPCGAIPAGQPARQAAAAAGGHAGMPGCWSGYVGKRAAEGNTGCSAGAVGGTQCLHALWLGPLRGCWLALSKQAASCTVVAQLFICSSCIAADADSARVAPLWLCSGTMRFREWRHLATS